MDQEIDQLIDVIVVFQKGRMVPVSLIRNGRATKIGRITGRWNTKEGRFHIQLFAPAVVSRDSLRG